MPRAWLVGVFGVACAGIGAGVYGYVARSHAETDRLRDEVDTLHDEIAALREQVAQRPAPAPVSTPADVQIELASEPAGADVIDAASGQRVGKTPLVLRVIRSTDARTFRLRASGYADELVEITPDRDVTYRATLSAAGTATARGGCDPFASAHGCR